MSQLTQYERINPLTGFHPPDKITEALSLGLVVPLIVEYARE
jgi:hypothetical protein